MQAGSQRLGYTPVLYAVPIMTKAPLLQEDLIKRYDRPGPRYSSYPPAAEFHDRIGERNFREWARASNEELIPKPLSLYFHIPFCSSICYFGACSGIETGRREEAEPYLRDMYREIEIRAELFDRDREVRLLHWGGGTPGYLTQAQSEELMERIARHFKLCRDDDGEYSIEIDPREYARGGLKHVRGLGFNRIAIGVQDFDERVQQAVGRTQDFDAIATIIEEARRSGIRSVNIDLIHGLPLQTVESFSRTLERIVDLVPDRIAIHDYAHLPHRVPPQRRIQAGDLPGPSEKLAILDRTVEMLIAAGYEHVGMDQFARTGDKLALAQRKRGLRRDFQGCSAQAQCDSIGFGVSAISHVSDNFAQNASGRDTYHASLARRQLPVARGHESSADDILRREIIRRLCCHFRLDIGEISRNCDVDFLQHFADELKQLAAMEADGLIEIGEDEICVLAPGRLLVRNICMVFDAYRQPAQAAGLFSGTV